MALAVFEHYRGLGCASLDLWMPCLVFSIPNDQLSFTAVDFCGWETLTTER